MTHGSSETCRAEGQMRIRDQEVLSLGMRERWFELSAEAAKRQGDPQVCG